MSPVTEQRGGLAGTRPRPPLIPPCSDRSPPQSEPPTPSPVLHLQPSAAASCLSQILKRVHAWKRLENRESKTTQACRLLLLPEFCSRALRRFSYA
ncbi:hypothetical protein AAHA92_21394 [Salvia divinorum]|uniref:Uncharacterized protein n=1 Tax=Salvia divinorum TaxID=28513 RepID=A0ABD1GKA7_SALDI